MLLGIGWFFGFIGLAVLIDVLANDVNDSIIVAIVKIIKSKD